MSEKKRLNKFISESGYCSRREADKFIKQGHVSVNGKRASVGVQVSVHDKVMVNGHQIQVKFDEEFVFLAFNKPVGIISTTEIGVKDSIIDYIGYHERIFPIGRLDKDSHGLIFLTNNGDIVNKILRAGNKHEKEYIVTVNKPITDLFIEKMANGVPMLGETTKKCKVIKESVYTFRIILVQGLNRQIRRMCEYFDYEVTKLERVRIMNIGLKGIPLGDWRQMEKHEISEIMQAIADSTSEAKPTKGNAKSAKNVKTSKPTNQKTERSKIANQMDRVTNPNQKSKALRGQSTGSTAKKGGRGAAANFTKPSKGRAVRR